MGTSQFDSQNHTHPVEILQKLMRFNPTNPPNNETECITYIFSATIHAANERVPAAAIELSANAIYKPPQRFGQDHAS